MRIFEFNSELVWSGIYDQVTLIMLTVQASPDEDPMSLKYVWRLSAPERPVLTRIAKDRCGRQRPAMGQVERARALLKCDAGPEGVAVQPAEPRGEAQRLQWAPVCTAGRPSAGDRCGRWLTSGRRGGLCPASTTRQCVAR